MAAALGTGLRLKLGTTESGTCVPGGIAATSPVLLEVAEAARGAMIGGASVLPWHPNY